MSKLDIAILGSMGSGKSTISKALSEKLGYTLFEESFVNNPFLEKYYENPVQYAFKNQLWFLHEKAKQHNTIGKYGGGTVQDSPIESCLIFMNAMYGEGLLNYHEYVLLRDLYDLIYRGISYPDRIIYLNTDVNVILERVRERGREFESVVDEEYIRASVCALDNFVYDKKSYISEVNGNGSVEEIVAAIIGKL